MKQKRAFIAILLVLVLLCLGIAYAVISGVDLNITGQVSATATDANVNVKFTDAQKDESLAVTIGQENKYNVKLEEDALVTKSGIEDFPQKILFLMH